MMQPILTIARFTALEGMRNRFPWLAGGMLLTGFAIAEFAGMLAIAETREIQSALLGAFLRFAAVILMALLVLTIQVREINDKGMDLILSLPLPRASYFFGKFAGFALIALPLAALCGLMALIYAAPMDALVWSASLGCELLLVIALALFCLFTFDQVPAAFTTVLGIYLLARVLESLLLVAQGPIMPSHSIWLATVATVLGGMAFLLPELHRFTASEWLVYGVQGDELLFVLGQTSIYLVFLWGAGLFDLYRKNL